VRVFITGATGLLGGEVAGAAEARGWEWEGTGRAGLDVTDADAVQARLSAARPGVVIHCAAYTAVDRAEEEPDVAMAVNRDGTRHVVEAAHRIGARVVYLSTDYVFDGKKGSPYLPDDPPRALSVYARSKLAGEEVALRASSGAAVVRTSWLYGAGRRSFVTAMIERAAAGEDLTVVDDQFGSPTWARNVATALLDLVGRGVEGVWHVSDRGVCSWAELAREALRLRGLDVEVKGVTSAGWGALAERPLYSALDLSATEKLLGRRMQEWREALAEFLSDGGGK
jgi:dTDP-4-dehydrorhamnose reductase